LTVIFTKFVLNSDFDLATD